MVGECIEGFVGCEVGAADVQGQLCLHLLNKWQLPLGPDVKADIAIDPVDQR